MEVEAEKLGADVTDRYQSLFGLWEGQTVASSLSGLLFSDIEKVSERRPWIPVSFIHFARISSLTSNR